MQYDPQKMNVTPYVALEVAAHEGLVRQAYLDSVGKWTWSIGLTDATGHRVERYRGKPQTLAHCLAVFVWALNNYAKSVRAEFPNGLPETKFASGLSFHWNTGSINSASWPDIWKAGRIDEARDSFLAWRKPPEIIERREDEANLFFDGTPINPEGDMTEWTELQSNGRPDWSSGKRIDIRGPLEALLVADERRGLDAEAAEPAAADTIAALRRIADIILPILEAHDA